MAAPVGNQFWRARSSCGRNPKFSSPEKLWDACCEYFEWVDNNPIKVQTPKGEYEKPRPMTVEGLCIFLDISTQTFYQYRKKDDFHDFITRAEAIIRQQKFAGATSEQMNPQIIARDLGLKDQQEISGPEGGPVEISDTELSARLATLMNITKRQRDNGES